MTIKYILKIVRDDEIYEVLVKNAEFNSKDDLKNAIDNFIPPNEPQEPQPMPNDFGAPVA